MHPAVEYLLGVGPVLLAVAVGSTLVGILLGAVAWYPGQAKRKRMEREIERLHRDVRHARRAVR